MTSSALTLTIEDGIAVVTFDLPNQPINKFSAAVIAEFDAVLGALERDTAVQAAVLISGKADTFIAGADIDALRAFRSAEEASAASALGHAMMHRLEQSRAPVVAAVHGACLGGGLEAALACAYRIVTDHPRTVMAFPEVQLGLIPGAGGTQRLPRRVGLQAALDMILTGKNIRARRALQMGLADELVHPSLLRSIALQRARELAAGTPPEHAARKHGVRTLVLEDNPIGRALVFRQAREAALEKSRGNYPALPAALDAVAAGYHGPPGQGFAEEARQFGLLAMRPETRELIFLFYATTALKKDTGVEGDVAPLPVRKIGVIGTGFMGAGIAAIAAAQGIPVRFKDTTHAHVAHGIRAFGDVLRERLTKRQISRQQFDDQLSLVSGTIDYTGFGNAPLVIEAVFEDLSVKRQVLADAEAVLPSHAIFASNTSTIPIAQIAAHAKRPERVIGMHFFSPVQKMPLLEVIMTPRTAPEVVATAVAFGRTLGKTVIVVCDAPGFFANRVLAPYLNEAGRLLDDGVGIAAIDGALRDFGFPVGPMTLLDEVGLDIAGKSGAILAEAFGDRLRPSESLAKMLAAGRLGRKGRRGFYHYDDQGKKGSVDESVYALFGAKDRTSDIPRDDIQHRCVLAMINEAVRCLEDGIVRQPRDGDIGAVFGVGFPPFRGGPYRYVDAMGAEAIVRRLETLEGKHPGRFAPCAMLVEMAGVGRRFYTSGAEPSPIGGSGFIPS